MRTLLPERTWGAGIAHLSIPQPSTNTHKSFTPAIDKTVSDLWFRNSKASVLPAKLQSPIATIQSHEKFDVYAEFVDDNEKLVVGVKDHLGAVVFATDFSVAKAFDAPAIKSPATLDGMRIGATIEVVSAFVAWEFARLSYSLKMQESSSQAKKSQDSVQSLSCPRLADGTYQMVHDMICTKILPPDGVFTIEIWGCGTTRVNAFECCEEHDISLWCADNSWKAMWADQVVVDCVRNATRKALLANFDGFFCKVFVLLLVGLESALLWANVLSHIAAFFVWLWHDEDVLGYGGRNKESCLCGGSAPTQSCYGDKCEDLCTKRYRNDPGRTYGKTPKCTKCRIQCTYDEWGKAGKRLEHVKDDPSLPCCVGTDLDCLSRGKTVSMECPDRCAKCSWECQKWDTKFRRPRNPPIKRLTKDREGLPCCGGPPPEPIGDWCVGIPEQGGSEEERRRRQPVA